MSKPTWPQKKRELIMWVADSRPWNDFRFRPDDIVVSTWSKSGTTWTQEIVSQLVFGGKQLTAGSQLSPWPDARMQPDAVERAEAQTHRRFLKTHLPLENLVYAPEAKYIYVGRGGRDAYWSWHNHHESFTEGFFEFINAFPDRDGPPYTWPNTDIRQAFHEWLDSDAYPNWSFFDHVQGWWDYRDLPNMLFVHFNDLKADLRGQIERIADFLDIPVAPETWPLILEHCSFDWMRNRAVADVDAFSLFRERGASFFNKGTNGRWRDVLTEADNAKYLEIARARLSADCFEWLER